MILRNWFDRIALLIMLAWLAGCGFYGRQRGPTDWHRIPKPNYTLPPYAQYVKGLTFCLDPGHGGDAHIAGYKRGPTGVREAEMNLRVALYLKDWLEQAGATVILTRSGDDDVSLAQRAEIANRNRGDMFISLHHNWGSNPRTNYPSTWYHGDADYSPVSLDLARYIQLNLAETLRLPQLTPCGLLSDHLMYPTGFGVLRRLQVPGILIETSFYSDPYEEKLLAKPAYNKLEAWSHFTAICQWATAGLPTARLLEPADSARITSKTPRIRIALQDGLHHRKGVWILERQQLFSRSIHLSLNGNLIPFDYDDRLSIVTYTPPLPLSNGWHSLTVGMRNLYGNHNLPRLMQFKVAPPAHYLLATPWTDRAPARNNSLIGIAVRALDADSLAVADDDTIFAATDRGALYSDYALTRNGLAWFYLEGVDSAATVRLQFRSGAAQTHSEVVFADSGATLIQGRCYEETSHFPLDSVRVDLLPPQATQFTNPDGHFALLTWRPASMPSVSRARDTGADFCLIRYSTAKPPGAAFPYEKSRAASCTTIGWF